MINQSGIGIDGFEGTALPPHNEITASTRLALTTAAHSTSTTKTTTSTSDTSLVTTIQQQSSPKPKKIKTLKNSVSTQKSLKMCINVIAC